MFRLCYEFDTSPARETECFYSPKKKETNFHSAHKFLALWHGKAFYGAFFLTLLKLSEKMSYLIQVCVLDTPLRGISKEENEEGKD